MGRVRMPFNLQRFGLAANSNGMDVKLLVSTLLQLPEGTKFVGMELGTAHNPSALLFEHPLLKDGAELTGNYRRNVAVVDNEVKEVDHFIGLDLENALVRDNEQ